MVFLVLARLLAPSAFGLFAYAQAFVVVVQAIADTAVSTIVVQRPRLSTTDLDAIFWTNLGLAAVLTLFGILGGPHLAHMLNEPQLGPLIRVLSVSLLIAGLGGVQMGVLRRDFDFKAVAFRSVGGEVVGGVLGVAAVVAGAGVWGLVIQRLVAAAAGTAILWARSPWRPGFTFSSAVILEVGGFGLSVVGSRVLWVLTTRIDDFLIGYFLGPTALGYYTIAYRITRFLTGLLSGALLHVALSSFSRLQTEVERLRRGMLATLRLSGLLSVPVFLWLLVMAEPLTVALFGQRWLPTVPVMRVLALIGVLGSVRTVGESVVMASGRPAWWFRLEFGRAALMAAGILLVVEHGILEVAWVVALSQVATVPILLLMMCSLAEMRLSEFARQYKTTALGSAVMLAAAVPTLIILRSTIRPFLLLVVGGTVAASVYSLTVFFLDRPTARLALSHAARAISTRGSGN